MRTARGKRKYLCLTSGAGPYLGRPRRHGTVRRERGDAAIPKNKNARGTAGWLAESEQEQNQKKIPADLVDILKVVSGGIPYTQGCAPASAWPPAPHPIVTSYTALKAGGLPSVRPSCSHEMVSNPL